KNAAIREPSAATGRFLPARRLLFRRGLPDETEAGGNETIFRVPRRRPETAFGYLLVNEQRAEKAFSFGDRHDQGAFSDRSCCLCCRRPHHSARLRPASRS